MDSVRTIDAPTLLAKSVDKSRMTVTAALTYPVRDRDGDIVVPTGGDWTPHEARPQVGLEHFRKLGDSYVREGDPGYRADLPMVVVGWARESLSQPGAPYAVEEKSVAIDGETHRLPFGTTYFVPGIKLSEQTFRLVDDDTLPGVSIEFAPIPGHYKSLGPSLLRSRDAFEFSRWTGLGYVHCAVPVNPGALTLSKSLPAHVDRAIVLAQRGKLGDAPLHPVLLKSFSPYLALAASRPVSVSVEKAMPDAPDPSMAAAYDPDMGLDGAEDAAPDTAPPNNGVTALYSHAQGLLDLCDQLEQDIESSDSPELRKEAMKLCEMARTLAEKAKQKADTHDAKLQAMKGGGDEPPPEEDAEPAEPDMGTDDEGVLKAVRTPYYKALKLARVKRFSKADVGQSDPLAGADPKDVRRLVAVVAELNRNVKLLPV